ncbi:uncharacterized protein (TIGR04141 family) [Azospira oryzae]|uniref:Uncharacterized protein (TIGR04141 family) n=1 Tax=Azospira oryzae TaxID=146939 RepID=A0ABY0IUX6_9RHOO|nr:DUF6119 family protein [Azospira oryzae]RZT90029.1 uncharacterized protein (TIGR04141 family) [Azospira oryzae]
MAKSRSFSIYLLKPGYSAANALRLGHALADNVVADNLPDGATLYILDSVPRPPWWKEYFAIDKELTQVQKGALIFLPVRERCFVLSFGHVSHNLLDASYEYDFGLRVTLNSLDPRKLKSTDTLDPGAAKRMRTQLPVESELTYFDFDRDSTILRSLTGKVREECRELFRHATGGSNLRISSDISADQLCGMCERLLALYEDDQYKVAFPEIQNIVPVCDPAQIFVLNDLLLQAFRERDTGLCLTVPDIVNYSDNVFSVFLGAGSSLIYNDVHIDHYFGYLDEKGIDREAVDIEVLRGHSLVLTDENGSPRNHYTIFKSLVFDACIEGEEGQTYHLCEGSWYKVDRDYVARLSAYLDSRCADCDLAAYTYSSEGEYNQKVSDNDNTLICLDMENISPDGQKQVEPCDLLRLRGNTAAFYHVKLSTLSAQLSHLFNQGVNAIELLRLEPRAQEKLEALIRDRTNAEYAEALISCIREQNCCVVFAIVTPKDATAKSLNLPLFSRISLMRNMKALQLMNIPAEFVFVADQSAEKEGRKRKRTRRTAPREDAGEAAAVAMDAR